MSNLTKSAIKAYRIRESCKNPYHLEVAERYEKLFLQKAITERKEHPGARIHRGLIAGIATGLFISFFIWAFIFWVINKL
jgi:hypothetical protein